MEQSTEAIGLIASLVESAKLPLFVIIDEYDHFANDLIAMGNTLGDDVYRRMVSANGMIRDFYENIKAETKTTIARIFVTGASPVMINDLTSGFNIANNLTIDARYNEMLGFTQSEVESMAGEAGISLDALNIDIAHYYNGYLFSIDGKERVYNPAMILYFFDKAQRTPLGKFQLVDPNMKTDYQRLRLLVREEGNRKTLMAIAKNGGIYSEITQDFSIDSMQDRAHFVSLLFYMGLLTIDKDDSIGGLHLAIPNYSVQTLYWEYIWKLTVDIENTVQPDSDEQDEAIRALAFRGELKPYIDYVSKHFFNKLSNRDLLGFDEKYIKLMLLSGIFQSNLYLPVSEREVTGGYSDVILERARGRGNVKYEWVWELKYLKESEAGAEAVKAALDQAAEQLARYKTDPHFAGRTDIKYAALLFIGKKDYELKVV
jgi:hypothetical protein